MATLTPQQERGRMLVELLRRHEEGRSPNHPLKETTPPTLVVSKRFDIWAVQLADLLAYISHLEERH